MEFVFKKPNYNLSDDEIIADVLRVKNMLGKDSLIMKEYFAHGRYGSKAIKNHFGTWNNLLDKLEINKTRVNQHLSKEDIFELIKQLWLDKGRQPILREFETETHHTRKIIQSNFGTWLNCLQEFVLWANSRGDNLNKNDEDAIIHKTPREPSDSLRYKVLTRDQYKCVMCGRSPVTTNGLQLHIDHIKPYSLGGETVLSNLQTLCQDCNLGKSNSTD